MRIVLIFLGATLLALAGCKSSESAGSAGSNTVTQVVDTKPTKPPRRARYNPSETREHDLLHTRLEVSFDWEKQYCNGTAELTLHPYWYATNTLNLDAKGFDLKKVALATDEVMQDLKYDYDGAIIAIELDKTYQRTDTFKIYIEYTAKPNELEEGGSAAITSDKGLYFINPDGTEDKPQQIWTQGETEASSCWFPTIDSPNERMTQELAITVENRFKTLSNGTMAFSEDNGNGTRTDHWKQDLPHAPYLVMMAIGEFAVVEDTWRDSVDVHYFVEPDYEADARSIFPNTPEMLEFFSQKLGVDYPWDKYHQVVVRDYVSGAMENTSAVIFGEFVQQTAREAADGDYEDVVSHELFHHWFGDLVTCESWANLPLNESFATYGEYLWREHKYGREAADHHIDGDLRAYLQESTYKQVDLIRFNHSDKEKMFDAHSYQKGGRVLHMLRKYVGDEAFFESLRLYLEDNRYQAVEMHNLRLACEEVTGEDLNWFFNQWFFSSGHPQLSVEHNYIDSLRAVRITVKQLQDFEKTPLYRLPIDVDVYTTSGKMRHRIDIDQAEQSFLLGTDAAPSLVIFDAENMLLGTISHEKSTQEYIEQYKSPLFRDRLDALSKCAARARRDEGAADVLMAGLNDSYWRLRQEAVDNMIEILSVRNAEVKAGLMKIAKEDDKAAVRAAALRVLTKNYNDKDLLPLYKNALNDQSYTVMGRGLAGVASIDKAEAMKLAKPYEQEESMRLLMSIGELYADYGSDEQHQFFVDGMKRFTGFSRIGFMRQYRNFLTGDRSVKVVQEGIDNMADYNANGPNYFTRAVARQALNDMRAMNDKRLHDVTREISTLESKDMSATALLDLRKQRTELEGLQARFNSVLENARRD